MEKITHGSLGHQQTTLHGGNNNFPQHFPNFSCSMATGYIKSSKKENDTAAALGYTKKCMMCQESGKGLPPIFTENTLQIT